MKRSTNSSKSMAKKAMLSSIFAGIFFASTAMADTLRVIADGDLKTIDPIVTTSGTTLVHAYLIYDKLFEFDKDGVARPQLADKVDISADKKAGRADDFTGRPERFPIGAHQSVLQPHGEIKFARG